jgi:hypothetical protein
MLNEIGTGKNNWAAASRSTQGHQNGGYRDAD